MSLVSRSLRPARSALRIATPRPLFQPLLIRPLSTPPPSTIGLRLRVPRNPSRRWNSTTTSTLNTGTLPPPPPPNGPPKSAYARFKELTKTYGSYAVIMYLALSAVDFTLSFLVVHAVGADHIEPAVKYVVRKWREVRHGKPGADALEAADKAKKAAEAAEEAVDKVLGRKPAWYENKTLWAEITLAYAIHKVGLLPIRAGLTVAWTPKVVNFLRARGWIGTSGTKRAVQHGAGKFREAGDKMREASQRAMDRAKNVGNRGD